jgi:hypothetical protein
MTPQTGEDIVERALLCLLAPHPAPKLTLVKKKKTHLTKAMVSQGEKGTIKEELLPARISIVERLSSVTLSICWSDSITGYFGEQIWRMSVARGQSSCALTGMPIEIGDSVFRPWASERRAPANGHRMILASCVDIPNSRS